LPVSWLDRQPPEVSKWQLTKRAALTESLRKLSQTCVDAELRSLAPGGPHRWRGAIPPHILAILGRWGLPPVNQKAESSRRERSWLLERNTYPNTVLENRKSFRFSGPLTNGKSSEMDFRCESSVINDQTAALRIHHTARRASTISVSAVGLREPCRIPTRLGRRR
jgi:hypothetical protein